MQNKKKRKGRVFQALYLSHIYDLKRKTAKGTSPVILNLFEGSLTVEAAFVLPIVFFVSLMLLSTIDMMQLHVKKEKELHSIVRQACVLGLAKGDSLKGQEGDLVRLNIVYHYSPKVKAFGYQKFLLENHCMAHAFTGYDLSHERNTYEAKEYVYITEYGSVYHKRRDCRYINVSVRAVSMKNIRENRNVEGKKYYPCEKCLKSGKNKDISAREVYVTDYGDRYHASIQCSKLKRQISVISLSEAGSYIPCSMCTK